MKKFFLPIFILTPIIFLSGCFEIKREIKIYPNGGGIENCYITLDKPFMDALQSVVPIDALGRYKKYVDTVSNDGLLDAFIKRGIQRVNGISIKELTINLQPDGSKQIYIQYLFDEPSAIIKVIKEATYSFSNRLNINIATLKFTDDEKLKFRYVIRNASRYYDDSLSISYFSNQFSKKLSHTIEFPFDVTSTNASTQAGNILSWETTISDILYGQAEMTAEMTKDQSLALTYAEKVDRTIGKVSQKENPLIRVQVYNGNKDPVKIGTGVIIKDNLLVTNFTLMNIIEGGGFFSIILGNDSLAGIDDMNETDIDQKQDIIFLRFSNFEKVKTFKFASVLSVTYGQKVKIFYYPNTLSSIVYAMDGMISGTKKWTPKTGVIEVKPAKPLSLEGGAVFNEAGEFLGIITTEFNGEVGKIYIVPAEYIKTKIPFSK